MIYLDYTANTPADPDVLDAYLAAERRYIANPNSTHIAGQEARAEMERVTQSIAQDRKSTRLNSSHFSSSRMPSSA